MLGASGALDAGLDAGTVTVDGDLGVVRRLIGLLDHFDPNFSLVEPNRRPE